MTMMVLANQPQISSQNNKQFLNETWEDQENCMVPMPVQKVTKAIIVK